MKEVAEPTPRQERIGHDYGQEFPRVEVESRRLTSAGRERSALTSAGAERNAAVTAAGQKQTAAVAVSTSNKDLDKMISLQDEVVHTQPIVSCYHAVLC